MCAKDFFIFDEKLIHESRKSENILTKWEKWSDERYSSFWC